MSSQAANENAVKVVADYVAPGFELIGVLSIEPVLEECYLVRVQVRYKEELIAELVAKQPVANQLAARMGLEQGMTFAAMVCGDRIIQQGLEGIDISETV